MTSRIITFALRRTPGVAYLGTRLSNKEVIMMKFFISSALIFCGFINTSHAATLDSAKEYVDVPSTTTPKTFKKSYGKQMADWQKKQLEQEKDYRMQLKSHARMETNLSPKGTVENVHPLMSKTSPHLDFSN